MIRKAFWMFFAMVLMAAMPGPGFGAGGTADDTLKLTLPYVTVGADRYRALFDFVQLPQDPSGAYWKLTWAGKTPVAGPQGGVLDASLNILNAVVMYRGQPFDLDLTYTPNPQDPSGAYWKLTRLQALPVRIQSVGGGDDSCYDFSRLDPATIQQMIQCFQNCGDNAQCLYGCIPPTIGATFKLSVTFLNESSEAVEFFLPPGMVFYPQDSSYQPMMVLYVPPYILQPGLSTFCVPTYCLAANLSAPGSENAYTPGAITGLACLYEIVELTFGKTLSFEAQAKIQDIIWDCSETGTLSPEDRAYLQGLP